MGRTATTTCSRAVSSTFRARIRGDGFADLLLGLPTVTILADNDNPQALRTTAINLFAQDDWRVTGRLTVNAGLRYELNTAPVDVHNRMVIFDPATAALLPVGENGVPRAGVDDRSGRTLRRASALPGRSTRSAV